MEKRVIGTVYLNVASLERLLPFYQDVIGLQVHRREDNTVYLGAGETDLLALTERPDSQRVVGATGLYHFALLTPSRLDLARSLRRLLERRTPLQGFADHLVSEAIYLADPEGNGIEIYRDRPRSEWYKNGRMQMDTLPLDVEDVLNTLNGAPNEWSGLHPDTIMGHIHLHVQTIPETEAFYRDLLGLDTTFNLAGMGATFLSYAGYHHHVGANIWAGRKPPPPDVLGLDKYLLNVPGQALLDDLLARLDAADVPVTRQDEAYLVQDPSRNRIVLMAN